MACSRQQDLSHIRVSLEFGTDCSRQQDLSHIRVFLESGMPAPGNRDLSQMRVFQDFVDYTDKPTAICPHLLGLSCLTPVAWVSFLFIYVAVLWDGTQGPKHAGQEEPDTQL